MKYLYGCEDVKNETGLWLRSYHTRDSDGNRVCHRARAGFLWQDMQKRCSPSNWTGKYSYYEGSENKFTSFQEFAEWCQGQYGYMSKTEKHFWSLDKDLKIPGNRNYSPDACMFVPNWINSLTTDKAKARGEFPIGASWIEHHGYFTSHINNRGKLIALGKYKCPEDAHKAWQVAKAEYLWELCESDPILQEHHVARESLQTIADRVYSDWLFNKETKSVARP